MKPKKTNYILIPQEEGPYEVLNKALAFHDDLPSCRIAMAWRVRTKEDVDGRIVLGKCVKVTDLQKEFAAYDFIIVLNREYWLSFDDKQRLALVDHELMHAAPKYDDKTGEPVYDERGRRVWRSRKHDLEEFTCVVDRHGLYKRDLERFAIVVARQKAPATLFEQKVEQPEGQPCKS